MNATAEVSINPTIIFYGPHPCDLCGKGPIVRGSVEQGFGDIRLDSPNEPIYPNHKWEEHKCGCVFQIGQPVEWDGQEGTCNGTIGNITEPFPGNYVLWIGDSTVIGVPINASEVRPMKGRELVKPLADCSTMNRDIALFCDDEGLRQFMRDSSALKTKVEHRWSAWLDDREDGIVGTGATEIEAIKALADQQRDRE
jgi:hypothetical protein